MKRSETTFLLTLSAIACCCLSVIVLSAGCDLGTYGERVESTGGVLTPVSQDAGSAAKDSGSAAKDAGSDSKDAGSAAKETPAGSESKDAGSDTKESRSEEEGRARAAGSSGR